MMASLRETSDVDCGKNAGPVAGILLTEFKPSDIPENYRSQRNFALLRMKAILVVKLVVTIGSSEYSGSGCVIDLHNSNNDYIEFIVRTVAHLGYEEENGTPKVNVEDPKETMFKNVKLNLFIPDTDLILESRNVVVKNKGDIDIVEDIAILRAKFPRNSFTCLTNVDILTDVHNALIPNVNTLCELVLRKYQKVKFPLPSFLKDEINCLKDIKFASDKPSVLEIQIHGEHAHGIDIMLFMLSFASHPRVLRELLERMASNSNIDTPCPPVTVVNKQITKQFGILDELLTSLRKPLTVRIEDIINYHYTRWFPFEISCVRTKSNVMTMLVGSTPLSEQKSEEVGMATGQDLRLLDENRKAGKGQEKQMRGVDCFKLDDSTNLKYEIENQEHETELIDIGLDVNRMKEKQDSRLSCLNTRRREQEENATLKFEGVGYENTKEEADLTLVTMKPPEKKPVKGSEHEKTLASLISYPHGNEPQRITFGVKKRSHNKEVFYTTPSYSGSSGGLICLIPENPGTELKDIHFATHSNGTDVNGMHVAVKGAGLDLKNTRSVTASAAMEDNGVGVLFTF